MLIPAAEQGLPLNRFDPLDRIVPRSRAPEDTDSSTLKPYVPSAEDAARHRTEQPGIAYDGQVAVEAERRQAVDAYEKAKQ
jgi:hypothetical protein